MDKITKARRSWNMSRIRATDTKPELQLRQYLYKQGLRYRLRYPLFGKPDLVFPKLKIAIFIHGCFWHQHGCKNSTLPKSNMEFWREKLKGNIERDKIVKIKLTRAGWRTTTVWECNLSENPEREYKEIKKLLI